VHGRHRHDLPQHVSWVETYNVFNNTNFGTPAANISNPNVGIITTVDEPRYIQLAMRLAW
jgi:hypothetical protein